MMMIALAGCSPEPEPDPALGFVAVTGVTGVPVQVEVNKDLTLSGTVVPSDTANKPIVWSKKSTGTTVTGDKLEATTTGTVIVMATIAKGKSETEDYTQDFDIRVYLVGQAPTVTGVTVTPETATVAPGGTETVTATVNGTNNPSQAVTWSTVETGKKAGTTISTTGLLTVANNETLTSLTVKATSNADNTKSGMATVTLSGSARQTQGCCIYLFAPSKRCQSL